METGWNFSIWKCHHHRSFESEVRWRIFLISCCGKCKNKIIYCLCSLLFEHNNWDKMCKSWPLDHVLCIRSHCFVCRWRNRRRKIGILSIEDDHFQWRWFLSRQTVQSACNYFNLQTLKIHFQFWWKKKFKIPLRHYNLSEREQF